MIPTYNCAEFLRKTLTSVLSQDPGPEVMQIEVIDDFSNKDDPQKVVEELGRGRVRFFRQPRNVGYIKNFETCLQRATGHLVHLLHGDDYVKMGFYQKLQSAFEKKPEIGAAFCFHSYVDEQGRFIGDSPKEETESGILKNWLARIAAEQRIQTPSIVVRRSVYEHLGAFDRRFTCCGEDWEMWVRIAANYPVWYEASPLAIYRIHSNSLSGNSIRTGANIKDLRMAIAIMETYLPTTVARRLSRKALENLALYAIRYQMVRMLAIKDFKGAWIQLREGLSCSSSPRVILSLLNIFNLKSNFDHETKKRPRTGNAEV